jgi:citronellol/citronellal dehydrogenase
MSFQSKTVIITGASRGIGKAIGLRLAKEGANIVIASKKCGRKSKTGRHYFFCS